MKNFVWSEHLPVCCTQTGEQDFWNIPPLADQKPCASEQKSEF